ncbi:hypothetical protein JCM5353_003307 [Sporobolomyces roseus]
MAGKSTQSNKDTSSTPQPKKRPAASEIDDIFSKKSKPADTTSSTSTPAETGVANKKKKDKKGKGKAEAEGEVQKIVEVIAQPKKIPETVVDTSSAIESYKPTAVTATKKAKDLTEEERKAIEEEKAFMDSRGTRKKTEDGLPIYDTSELKIGLGGDTELCPFDCECCF